MVAFKWTIYAQYMIFMLNLVPTERAHRGMLSHRMIGNALSWYPGVEVCLDESRLDTMTVQKLCEILDSQFVPDTTRELIREFRQSGMSVYAYAKCFNELPLFSLEDVTTFTIATTSALFSSA